MRRASPVLVPLAVLALTGLALAGCNDKQREATINTLASAEPSPTASPTEHKEPVPAPTFSGLPATATGPHEQADVDFLTTMTVRERQTEVMARMAGGHAGSEALQAFAEKVADNRLDELTLTVGWLRSWGAPVPPIAGDDSAGAAGMDEPGLLTAAELTALDSATGDAFDTQFVSLLTKLDQAAITEARQIASQTRNDTVQKYADVVASRNQAEIVTMQGLHP